MKRGRGGSRQVEKRVSSDLGQQEAELKMLRLCLAETRTDRMKMFGD